MSTVRSLFHCMSAAAVLAAGGAGASLAAAPTLADVEALALTHNAELAAGRAAADAARARATGVDGQRWPVVALSAGALGTDSPAQAFAARLNAGDLRAGDLALDSLNRPSTVYTWSTGLTVSLPLDIFGKISSAAAASHAAADALDASVDELAAELRLRVEQAYRRAALAEATIAVTEHAIAAAAAREADVEAAFEHGAALQADVLRARARRREREADLAARHAERDAALAELARLTGVPGDPASAAGDARGFEGPPATPAPLDEPLAAWLARAESERAALRAAAATLAAAEAQAQAAHRASRPDVGLQAALNDEREERASFAHGRTSATLGASVRWKAFDRTRRAETAAAESGRASAAEALRAARDAVRAETTAAYRAAGAARERWRAAAGGAEESAEAARVLRERRAAGVATLSDELAADAEALTARLTELRALADVALADAALRRAAGVRDTPRAMESPR